MAKGMNKRKRDEKKPKKSALNNAEIIDFA